MGRTFEAIVGSEPRRGAAASSPSMTRASSSAAEGFWKVWRGSRRHPTMTPRANKLTLGEKTASAPGFCPPLITDATPEKDPNLAPCIVNCPFSSSARSARRIAKQ